MQLFQLFPGSRFERRGPSGSLVVGLGPHIARPGVLTTTISRCSKLPMAASADGGCRSSAARRCSCSSWAAAARRLGLGLPLRPSHLEEHFDRVGQSGDPLGRRDGVVQDFRQPGLERDQMARRNFRCRQWKYSAAEAGPESACRTSSADGLDSAPAFPGCERWPRFGRPACRP